MLIGAGSSICGAAAVMATEPVVRGRRRPGVRGGGHRGRASARSAMFLYPALYPADLPTSSADGAAAYGLYAGSTDPRGRPGGGGRPRGQRRRRRHRGDREDGARDDAGAVPGGAVARWLAAATQAGAARATITIPWFALGFVGGGRASIRCTCCRPAGRRGHRRWTPCCWRWRWPRWACAPTCRRCARPASSRCCWPAAVRLADGGGPGHQPGTGRAAGVSACGVQHWGDEA